MSMQLVFDQVVLAMRRQGRPSTNENGHCRYRNATRDEVGKVTVLKCAVGCLIPDKVYDPAFEGVSLRSLPAFVQRELAARIDDPNALAFFADLQRAHDAFAGNAMPPSAWLHMFLEHAKEVAENFGLDQRAITQPLEEEVDATTP